jgi:hypothetical protein
MFKPIEACGKASTDLAVLYTNIIAIIARPLHHANIIKDFKDKPNRYSPFTL